MHDGRKARIIGAILITGLIVTFVTAYLTGWKIVYAPDLENDWEAISATATWVGAMGTVLVLWYNHRSISLTQRSVQQAINLQLYEKRLELYTALSRDDAFKQAPLEVKIVYSETIYVLYKQISDLCNQKANLMEELYLLTAFLDGKAEPCWNVGEEQFQKYMKQLELCIKGQDGHRKDSLIRHKNESQNVQDQIRSKYRTLEAMMRMVLKDSIKNR